MRCAEWVPLHTQTLFVDRGREKEGSCLGSSPYLLGRPASTLGSLRLQPRAVISWLLVISSVAVVLTVGWNPTVQVVVDAWVFILVLWGVTSRPTGTTNDTVFHKRWFWLLAVLAASPLVGLYVYQSEAIRTPLELLKGTLSTTAPLLALALVVCRGGWYRLPSARFWRRLVPLVLLVSLIKIVVGIPFAVVDMYFFSYTSVEAADAQPREELYEVPTTTNFVYSALAMSFSEELDRTGMLLAGLTNPFLNTLLWAVGHDLRIERWAEIVPPFADQPDRLRAWLTAKNLSFLAMLFCIGLVFFRVLKSEQSVWAAFLVHFLSNELPGFLFTLF